MVQRGLLAEAKQHFVEYADRMQKAGRVDEAFKALKELADLTPNNEALRLMLAEQLKAARGRTRPRSSCRRCTRSRQARLAPGRRSPRSRPLIQLRRIEGAEGGEKKGKSSDLVFLDLDAPAAPPPPKVAPAAAKPAPAPPKVAPPPAPRPRRLQSRSR